MRRLAFSALLISLLAATAAFATAQAGPQTDPQVARAERAAKVRFERNLRNAQRAIERERMREQRELKRQRRNAERAKKMAAMKLLRKARGYRRLKVDGQEVRLAVEKLTQELNWHSSLSSAQREAKRTGKPILWIHALGELTGVL